MTDPVLYIPLLASQADTLVDPSGSARVLLGQWDVAQVASVAVIQNLPALDGKPKSEMLVEKALAELISVGTELSQTHPPGTFSSLIAGRFKRELFERGLALMPRLRLRFLDEEALDAKQFLNGGHWTSTSVRRTPKSSTRSSIRSKPHRGKQFLCRISRAGRFALSTPNPMKASISRAWLVPAKPT